MTFGLSIEAFTVLHVVISMLAIFAGFVVIGGMFANTVLAGWTVIFLIMTILTLLTGFLFPIRSVTPALVVGVIASLILILALLASRLLSPFVFGISALDPSLYAGAALLLIAVACLAAFIPLRRAMHVDPITVLRAD